MITLPSVLESLRSLKDKTYKLTFETNELTPEQLTGIGQNLQQFGWLAFKQAGFGERDKLIAWLKDQPEKFYAQVKESKNGKWYGAIDDYKKPEKTESAPEPIGDEDNLPF